MAIEPEPLQSYRFNIAATLIGRNKYYTNQHSYLYPYLASLSEGRTFESCLEQITDLQPHTSLTSLFIIMPLSSGKEQAHNPLHFLFSLQNIILK